MNVASTNELDISSFNSGLGLAICCRLLDEFLETRPSSHCITLIFTTRSRQKAQSTDALIRGHLKNPYRDGHNSRVTLQPETLDLNSLRSIRSLSESLCQSIPKLDVIVLNAGMGGFTGLDWPRAVWTVLTDWVHAVTWPTYKKSAVGCLTSPQLPGVRDSQLKGESVNGSSSVADSAMIVQEEPPLGEVFCSNVFGHYMLVHWLHTLSSNQEPGAPTGRIVWISSLEAVGDAFSVSDIQGLRSSMPYESSKRLTELLALTSNLPSTEAWVSRFLPTRTSPKTTSKPEMYLMHPGICATSIVPLPYILSLAMIAAFYIARWIGSPWHTLTAYSGACAAVWLALSPSEQLHGLERDGKHKWGSATDLWGQDRVAETEVDGWGYGGVVGRTTKRQKGRRRGVNDLTAEAKVEFEELGRQCWKHMEELREEWERTLAEA